MRRRKVDVSIEEKIVIGMITDDQFLKEIRRAVKPEYFEQPFLGIISGWVTEYFDLYGKAPEDINNSTLTRYQ